MAYSTLPRTKAQGRIEFTNNNIHYFNREEIKFVTLEFFNATCKTQYTKINELIFNPPSFEEELRFRHIVTSQNYDLSPIIIVNNIPNVKLTIELNVKIYEDVKEKLLVL